MTEIIDFSEQKRLHELMRRVQGARLKHFLAGCKATSPAEIAAAADVLVGELSQIRLELFSLEHREAISA